MPFFVDDGNGNQSDAVYLGMICFFVKKRKIINIKISHTKTLHQIYVFECVPFMY
jgi:hypothetical protein